MIDLQLFRLKLTFVPQGDLLAGGFPERPAILQDAIGERPTAELRRGYEWHVGNVDWLDESAVYFAVGRVTRSTLPMFDEEAQEFQQIEFEQAPYTHAFVDVDLGLLAVARNSRLSPTVPGIARQVARLLGQTDAVVRLQGRITVDPLSDPEEFIAYLRAAWSITRFKTTFGLPNPFDADEDFQKPMERLLRESEGGKGYTVVKGGDLNSEVLEELSRSAAATGQDASARMTMRQGGDSVTRSLREKSVTIRHEEPIDQDSRTAITAIIRERYYTIRRDEDG